MKIKEFVKKHQVGLTILAIGGAVVATAIVTTKLARKGWVFVEDGRSIITFIEHPSLEVSIDKVLDFLNVNKDTHQRFAITRDGVNSAAYQILMFSDEECKTI